VASSLIVPDCSPVSERVAVRIESDFAFSSWPQLAVIESDSIVLGQVDVPHNPNSHAGQATPREGPQGAGAVNEYGDCRGQTSYLPFEVEIWFLLFEWQL
jgi:hypothetical protein